MNGVPYGSKDWVLEEVRRYTPPKAVPQGNGRSSPDGGALLSALAHMAMVDGELHEKEKQFLMKAARRRSIPAERAERIIESAGNGTLSVPSDDKQAKPFMDELICSALMDGRIAKQERELLMNAARQCNWVEADLKMAIRKNQAKLYQEAKAALRAKKQQDRREK